MKFQQGESLLTIDMMKPINEFGFELEKYKRGNMKKM